MSADRLSAPLVGIAGAGLVLVFGLWWWYFEHPADDGLRLTPRLAYLWGYAHYAVFAAVAAFGAGLEVAISAVEQGGHRSVTTAALAVAVPVGSYLVVTGAILVRLGAHRQRGWWIDLTAAALVAVGLAAPGIGLPTAVVVVVVVVVLVVVDALATGGGAASAGSVGPESSRGH